MTSWGILSPEDTPNFRRQQTLELAAAVRHFNDRSVPGLGGMWFAMPILWSVISVAIAQELKRPALPISNAIEARVMKHVLQRSDITVSPQVRGRRKLANVDPAFATLSRPGTYVVQPIRMTMIQPLVSLGFVKGRRYSAFVLAAAGERLLDLPSVRAARHLLGRWARGENPRGLGSTLDGLSPLSLPDPAVRKLIMSRLVDGDDPDSRRRRDLVRVGTGPTASQLEARDPLPGISVDHWRDLRAGAAFMDLQQIALSVLSKIDAELHQRRDRNSEAKLTAAEAAVVANEKLSYLKSQAALMEDRIVAGAEPLSCAFLRECLTLSPEELATRLAGRDGSVVTLRGEMLTLGPAGEHAAEAVLRDDSPGGPAESPFAPQLFRLRNLHCLVTELGGKANPRTAEHSIGEIA